MDQLELAPDLGKRVKSSRSFKDRLRNRDTKDIYAEPYVHNRDGLYVYPFFSDERYVNRESIHLAPPELEGTEKVLLNLLQGMAQAKKTKKNDLPVIFIDWGGGDGESVERLATRFPDGYFIVTNIAKQQTSGLSNVHFIQSSTAELLKQEIILKDGKRIPLKGNVDLVHEMRMLEHNEIADTDLLIMGRALSPFGIMLIGSNEAVIRSQIGDHPQVEIVRLGKNNLLSAGFKKIKDFHGRKSYYDVYAKPEAPIESIIA